MRSRSRARGVRRHAPRIEPRASAVGIARALYHDPAVLVLDEATSALDSATEQRIVEELDAMRGARTLIVIAHRMSTAQRCQRLYLLENGAVGASGTYDQLAGSSAQFRRLARTDAAMAR